jgi:hypothetical protein
MFKKYALWAGLGIMAFYALAEMTTTSKTETYKIDTKRLLKLMLPISVDDMVKMKKGEK